MSMSSVNTVPSGLCSDGISGLRAFPVLSLRITGWPAISRVRRVHVVVVLVAVLHRVDDTVVVSDVRLPVDVTRSRQPGLRGDGPDSEILGGRGTARQQLTELQLPQLFEQEAGAFSGIR